MHANTSTAEHTCNTLGFVFMLHQVTVLTGGMKVPSEFTGAAAQTVLCMSPVCGLWALYTAAYVGHLGISLKTLLHD